MTSNNTQSSTTIATNGLIINESSNNGFNLPQIDLFNQFFGPPQGGFFGQNSITAIACGTNTTAVGLNVKLSPSSQAILSDIQKKNKPLVPPAWKDEPDTASDGVSTCVICQTHAIATVCKPCKHACLCVTCSRDLANQEQSKFVCPICRAVLVKIVRLYLP